MKKRSFKLYFKFILSMRKILLSALFTLCLATRVFAVDVKVVMNSTSTMMTLVNKESGASVETGTPEGRTYTFEAPAGEYTLTGYASDSITINGTIDISITDEAEQEFVVLTSTVYATNPSWQVGVDYSINASVTTREGTKQSITIGASTNEARRCFLALSGNSYYVELLPSLEHQEEGYMTLYKSGTLTVGVTVNGQIPMGHEYSVSVPADAEFYMAIKFAHFVAYKEIAPKSVVTEGNVKYYRFNLAERQVYNFRTWRQGGVTQGGYFTMYGDKSQCPELNFTTADYEAFDPKSIKHDVNWNGGFETGDILVNINERGHLSMAVGDTYSAHAMRSWQLTDTQTNNYFIEPDFHYTVIGLDGEPCSGVIEIDNAHTTTSPWSTIRAVGKGTVIVLVTYDAIGVNYYSLNNVTKQSEKKPYMGGEFWSAIWPENTAVYVVSVGEEGTTLSPNMFINEAYNDGMQKQAGKFVDAEHDIFYYLDTEEGYLYTFKPEGVATVEIAYPTIGERSVSYSGFASEGVSKEEDGCYKLLLKEGRQIVKLTDEEGNSAYQVLTAKRCQRQIINAARPDSKIYQPGDKITIQYSGLRHPSNKLAGIYNMSAYVTYNGTPNGESLILSPNQYTFGSSATAQAVTVQIPTDYDCISSPEFVMNDGVIQVNGFGDPIGNHRKIDEIGGRSPNFTAIAHKTYFGAIPDVRIPITEVKNFIIRPTGDMEGIWYRITQNGNILSPNDDGTYTGTYGEYMITAGKAGYRCYRAMFNIADDAEGEQIVSATLVGSESDNAWDGVTLQTPPLEDGVYQISTASELAWYAAHVAEDGGDTAKALLLADIDLADYDWNPIGGNTRQRAYQGEFDGQGHTIKGVYLSSSLNNQGLFAYAQNATIKNLTVEGYISAGQYVGGVLGYAGQNVVLDGCVNRATIISSKGYAGGIVGYLATISSSVANSYNLGAISAPSYAGGIAGSNFATAAVTNVFNLGRIDCSKSSGGCVGGTSGKSNVTNSFCIERYDVENGNTLVTEEQMASGEIAYLLGERFGQEIGKDIHPVLGGDSVLYDDVANRYYNESVETAVTVQKSADPTITIYNIQGGKQRSLQHGLNIVIDNNGRVEKILIP